MIDNWKARAQDKEIALIVAITCAGASAHPHRITLKRRAENVT